MPLLWPFKVRTNSQELVDHTWERGFVFVFVFGVVFVFLLDPTLMVLSPLAETIYLSSKSTTFTAARCPTKTLLRLISVGLTMSQTWCIMFKTIYSGQNKILLKIFLKVCLGFSYCETFLTAMLLSLLQVTIIPLQNWEYWKEENMTILIKMLKRKIPWTIG